MKFAELAKLYPENQRKDLATLLIKFIDVQKRLNDSSDNQPKGEVVKDARLIADVLKKPPWRLDADFLWHIYLELDEYSETIHSWLQDSLYN